MLVLLIIGHIINGRIDINSCNTGNSLILMYMNGVLGTLVIMRVSMHFVSCTSIASVIASGGMLIVGFNQLAIIFAKKAWALLTAYPIDEIVGLMLSIIITVVFYAVILFCQRYFKIILGYR